MAHGLKTSNLCENELEVQSIFKEGGRRLRARREGQTNYYQNSLYDHLFITLYYTTKLERLLKTKTVRNAWKRVK
jgi:hypothetical protein